MKLYDIQNYGYMISAYDPNTRENPINEFYDTLDKAYERIQELMFTTSKNFISITPGTFHRFEAKD